MKLSHVKILFSHFAEDIQEEFWFRDKKSSEIRKLRSSSGVR